MNKNKKIIIATLVIIINSNIYSNKNEHNAQKDEIIKNIRCLQSQNQNAIITTQKLHEDIKQAKCKLSEDTNNNALKEIELLSITQKRENEIYQNYNESIDSLQKELENIQCFISKEKEKEQKLNCKIEELNKEINQFKNK